MVLVWCQRTIRSREKHPMSWFEEKKSVFRIRIHIMGELLDPVYMADADPVHEVKKQITGLLSVDEDRVRIFLCEPTYGKKI